MPMQEDMAKAGHGSSRSCANAPPRSIVVHGRRKRSPESAAGRALSSPRRLSAHFTPGPMNTLFVLDEFRAAVGKMHIINDMWSLVRGYGVQLMPILQSSAAAAGAVQGRMGKLRGASRPRRHARAAGRSLHRRMDEQALRRHHDPAGRAQFQRRHQHRRRRERRQRPSTGGGISSNQGNSFNNGRTAAAASAISKPSGACCCRRKS